MKISPTALLSLNSFCIDNMIAASLPIGSNVNYGRHYTVADSINLSEAVDEGEDDEHIDHNDDEEDPDVSLKSPMERAWRYAKKPLLRIGSKGATPKLMAIHFGSCWSITRW